MGNSDGLLDGFMDTVGLMELSVGEELGIMETGLAEGVWVGDGVGRMDIDNVGDGEGTAGVDPSFARSVTEDSEELRSFLFFETRTPPRIAIMANRTTVTATNIHRESTMKHLLVPLDFWAALVGCSCCASVS